MGRIPFALSSLSLVLIWTAPCSAQVRAGLAHRLDETEPAAEAAPAADAMTEPPVLRAGGEASHDPDSDGALIGAGIGVIVGMIAASATNDGEFGGLAVMFGGLGAGLVGLLVGAAVDAADPLTDPQATAVADTVAPSAAAAPADTVAAEGGKTERRCSGGTDAIAALAGAGLVGILLAGAGPEPALIAALVGAVVVGGVVSVVEDAEQPECPPRETARRPAGPPAEDPGVE